MEQLNLTRRQVVLGLLGVGALGAVGGALRWHPWDTLLDAAAQAGASSAGGNALVVITLAGGNDGLNTVVPYTDSAYLAVRQDMHFGPNEVLPLTDGLGLHPELTGLKALWDAGSLAIINGVGYPQPNRSHFRSMDIWQSGVPDRQEATGWLGRWLDAQSPSPMHAVSIGTQIPLLLTGSKRRPAAIPATGVAIPTMINEAYGELGAPDTTRGAWENVYRTAMRDLAAIQRDVHNVLPANVSKGGPGTTTTTTNTGVAAGRRAGNLRGQLDAVRAMLAAKIPTSVFHVMLGGFDTHATEKDTHANLMREFGDAVQTFLDQTYALGQPVTVVAYSEFGRRLALNASNGTDHGTAAPMFVAGNGVRSGLYGEYPSLTSLDDGDLKYTTDFRAVFGTLAARVLHVDPAQVLTGPQRDLGFLQ
ncbi:MAG: DUF1501 domain-containing protein [Acidimicrobiia bacterium]